MQAGWQPVCTPRASPHVAKGPRCTSSCCLSARAGVCPGPAPSPRSSHRNHPAGRRAGHRATRPRATQGRRGRSAPPDRRRRPVRSPCADGGRSRAANGMATDSTSHVRGASRARDTPRAASPRQRLSLGRRERFPGWHRWTVGLGERQGQCCKVVWRPRNWRPDSKITRFILPRKTPPTPPRATVGPRPDMLGINGGLARL